MIIDYLLIGMRVREIRLSAKLTQKFAELSDLSPVYISNIENNKKKTESICNKRRMPWYCR